MDVLTSAQARRLAVAAQGLRRAPNGGPVSTAALLATVRRLGAVQIDSVSAVVRSHYLPAFSRLGSYDRTLLEGLAYRRRALTEYWGHEASLLPVELVPLLRWRMRRARRGQGVYRQLAAFALERPGYVADVLAQVRDSGPLAAGELTAPGARGGPGWWRWGDGKRALEWLFWTGEVTVAERRNFARRYDLPERVWPQTVLDAPDVEEDEAQRRLLLTAAQASGVATAGDLCDFWRLRLAEGRQRIRELVADGRLRQVVVEGWREAAFMVPGTAVPRRVAAAALLSPFDSLVWCRPRVARLWGMTLRLEIYTPAHRRVHGYYVLPFLMGDRLVARVDLRAERATGVLRLHGVFAEPGAEPDQVAVELGSALSRLAGWLTLGAWVVEPDARGDLAPALRAAAPSGTGRSGGVTA